jgi:hypothetical protein
MRSIVAFIVLIALIGCDSEKKESANTPEEVIESIKEMESKISAGGTKVDTVLHENLVRLYMGFVSNNAQHKKVPEFLFRASQIAMGGGMNTRAIEIANQLVRDFPNYEGSPEAALMVGFIYENRLDQKGQAAEQYEKVIDMYPRDRMAIQARVSLRNLNTSDEELIRRFEEMNKKTETPES